MIRAISSAPNTEDIFVELIREDQLTASNLHRKEKRKGAVFELLHAL